LTFLRRDYVLADSVVNKAEEMQIWRQISLLDKQMCRGRSAMWMLKSLEDIRRTAEHASDIRANESNYQRSNSSKSSSTARKRKSDRKH
jgi:hypothetical protein